MPRVDSKMVHQEMEDDADLQEDLNNIDEYGTCEPHWVAQRKEWERRDMDALQREWDEEWERKTRDGWTI